MSRYTPVDFIAPNVEVEILYDAKWTKWIVKTVKKRSVFGNGAKFVFCDIQMLDKPHDVLNETLHDSDYECESSHFAWRFSDAFKPLVDQLLKVQELEELDEGTDDPDYEPSDDSDDEVDDDDVSDPDETDEEDDDDSEDDNENDDNVVYVKRSSSLTNRVFATLFMLSPWFASLAVVYNARDDIFKYLKNTYC